MIGISIRKLMKASSVALDVAFTYFHWQLEIIMNNTKNWYRTYRESET